MIPVTELRKGVYTFTYPSDTLYGGELLTNYQFRVGCGWVVESITKGTFELRWTMSGKNRVTMSVPELNRMFPNMKHNDEVD